eukprot:scaffold3764_cov50-Attheya_sp.AAC.1
MIVVAVVVVVAVVSMRREEGTTMEEEIGQDMGDLIQGGRDLNDSQNGKTGHLCRHLGLKQGGIQQGHDTFHAQELGIPSILFQQNEGPFQCLPHDILLLLLGFGMSAPRISISISIHIHSAGQIGTAQRQLFGTSKSIGRGPTGVCHLQFWSMGQEGGIATGGTKNGSTHGPMKGHDRSTNAHHFHHHRMGPVGCLCLFCGSGRRRTTAAVEMNGGHDTVRGPHQSRRGLLVKLHRHAKAAQQVRNAQGHNGRRRIRHERTAIGVQGRIKRRHRPQCSLPPQRPPWIIKLGFIILLMTSRRSIIIRWSDTNTTYCGRRSRRRRRRRRRMTHEHGLQPPRRLLCNPCHIQSLRQIGSLIFRGH